MTIRNSLALTALSLGVLASPATAMNVGLFTQLVQETVQEVIDGEVSDVAALLAKQDQLIAIGVEGARQYAAEHPEAAQILNFVADNAEAMKTLTLDEIEEAWHDYGAFEDAGIDADAFDHFGPVISHMDAVIHPATAYIALQAYAEDGDSDHLDQVKDELSEVLEHLSHI